jgi:hypothetical protein
MIFVPSQDLTHLESTVELVMIFVPSQDLTHLESTVELVIYPPLDVSQSKVNFFTSGWVI